MRIDAPVFTATVTARTQVTPNMLRLTFGSIEAADGADAFVGTARPDEFFGLWVPGGADGTEAKRYYSIRAWRPATNELDVDVVLHDAGPATMWARAATVGDRVRFDRPRGHYTVPAGTELVIIAGDATALPAIGRILDERAASPSTPRALVLVTVEHDADRQRFPVQPGDEVRWVHADALAPAVIAAASDAPNSTYLWFSGEASDMRTVRRHVRHGLGWPTSRWMTMGYWRRDEERWVAALATHEHLEGELDAIWTEVSDEEVARDRSDELLARYGL